MAGKCINKAIDWLICKGEIEEEDKELYVYALKNILNTLAPLFLALLTGLILRCPLRTILIIAPFVLLRKFSGGFHMESAVLCTISSAALLVACSLLSFQIHIPEGIFLVSAGACVSLIILSPRENENRPLSERERRLCRLWVTGIAGVLFILITVLYLFAQTVPLTCLGIGIAMSAALQYPCLLEKILKKYQN